MGQLSALGHKRTFAAQKVMSALPPKADICSALAHVCFGPKADRAVLSHGDQASPLASGGNLDAKGNKCKHSPTAMEENPRSYHPAAWDRANSGALQKIGKGG